jgi:PPP family 3-phenylpropionic acid transporter
MSAGATGRRQLAPFAALSASYFAHIGFFNPYLPLWLKELGFGLFAISVLTSVQAATRLFAPYGWGWLSDHTGERVKLLRYGASTALLVSLGLWFELSPLWLGAVLLVMFTHTSSMMPMSEAAMAHLVSQGGAFDARRYGRVRLWGSLGFLVTVFAAGAWFEHAGMGQFPNAWTTLTLAAVTVSVWFLPGPEGGHPRPRGQGAGAAGAAPARGVVVFCCGVFPCACAHRHLRVLLAVSGLAGLQQDHDRPAVGGVGDRGDRLVFHPVALAADAEPDRLAGAVLRSHGAAHGHHGQQRQRAGGALLLAQALHAFTFATHHTVCIALLSHHFPGRLRGRGQALYTVIAYGFPGVLGGACRRGSKLKMGPCQRVLVFDCYQSDSDRPAPFKVWRLQHPAVSAPG